MAQRAGYTPTVALWGQGADWFDTWKKQLFEASGAVVLFTTGDSKDNSALGNHGMGYNEKLSSRYQRDGNDAALYKEAMAILEKETRETAAGRSFFIYAIDGRKFTPEQMRTNLEDGAVTYGPVREWRGFIELMGHVDEV
jgi:hypothetical protein